MTLLGLLALALQDAPGRWDGALPGSWVIQSQRSISEPVPRLASTWREEVVQPDADGRPRLSTDGSVATPILRRSVLGTGLREIGRRRDELTVGGRTLPCTVVEYLGDVGTVVAWMADGVRVPAREMAALPFRVAVPTGVVRVDARYARNGGQLRTTLQVIDLSSVIEVAGRRLECVVELETSLYDFPSGSRSLRTYRRWLSHEVPGHQVRQDRHCSSDPTDLFRYTTRDEVLDFHLAR